MKFPRQEYWRWQIFPSPGDLPVPHTEALSPATAGNFFIAELPGKPMQQVVNDKFCRKAKINFEIKDSDNFLTIILVI